MSARTRDVTVRALMFEDDGRIPNNPKLPLVLYPGVLDLQGASDPAALADDLFRRHGWGGTWRNGVFPFPHYHGNAHEVLGVCAGRARIRLGGGKGQTLEVAAGDVVVLPAGTGHQNLGASPDFLVVGAYPAGQEDYDLRRGEPGERPAVLEAIRNVPLPAEDPVFGRDGPLLRHWRA